jgi:simple sugar transport system ATP-binding protein
MNEELPILSADGVSKRFGGVHALEEVSFELHPGEVLALAGDNGAGKSTLIKVISGVHRADDGHVTFRGQRLELSSPREARELGIETIYQDLALADNLDVAGNFFLGRERMRRFLGVLPLLDRVSMRESSLQAIESLDIHLDRADLPVRDLSGGQRQGGQL